MLRCVSFSTVAPLPKGYHVLPDPVGSRLICGGNYARLHLRLNRRASRRKTRGRQSFQKLCDCVPVYGDSAVGSCHFFLKSVCTTKQYIYFIICLLCLGSSFFQYVCCVRVLISSCCSLCLLCPGSTKTTASDEGLLFLFDFEIQ